MNLAPGTRVRLTADVERFPHFIARAGATGVVVDVGEPTVFAVLMDDPLPGCEAWNDEVHFYLDWGDKPADCMEVIA